MKRLTAAFALVVAGALIGGPAIADGHPVSYCHLPSGDEDKAIFMEDKPFASWDPPNEQDSGHSDHPGDFLTDSEEECEGGGDEDEDEDEDKDKDKDNDGKLAKTGV